MDKISNITKKTRNKVLKVSNIAGGLRLNQKDRDNKLFIFIVY